MNKVLLTGAGFSFNFGLPLAKDVWSMIFNSPIIQSLPKTHSLLLENQDYEDVYTRVLTGDDYETERNQFKSRLYQVFNDYFEKRSVWAINNFKSLNIDISDLRNFIKFFAKRPGEKRYLFTLNQDLFLERLFLKGRRPQMLVSPYIGNCIFNYAVGQHSKQKGITHTYEQLLKFGEEVWKNNEGLMPRPEVIANNSYAPPDKIPYPYIKLHGSIGWRDESQPENIDMNMIMGTEKDRRISEPLFAKYFDFFKDSINVPNSMLLVIGYSFMDVHVNEFIADAVENFGLRIHIINPTDISSLLKLAKQKDPKNIDLISKAIYGYYPNRLMDIFPYRDNEDSEPDAIVSDTPAWNLINENFIEFTSV